MRRANNVIFNQYDLGALSTSSKDLYRKLRWKEWLGPSYVVTNGKWIRTESEDAGIMILKIDWDSDTNLYSRIACEARSKDDW